MNQLDNYQDDTLIWGLFPKLDWVDIGRWGPESWHHFLNKGLKDPWIAFDTFIVASGWIETVMFFLAGIKLGGDILAVFRVFRLVRLIRLIKLMGSLRELWLLLTGMIRSLSTLFWATVMLMLVIYV